MCLRERTFLYLNTNNKQKDKRGVVIDKNEKMKDMVLNDRE